MVTVRDVLPVGGRQGVGVRARRGRGTTSGPSGGRVAPRAPRGTASRPAGPRAGPASCGRSAPRRTRWPRRRRAPQAGTRAVGELQPLGRGGDRVARPDRRPQAVQVVDAQACAVDGQRGHAGRLSRTASISGPRSSGGGSWSSCRMNRCAASPGPVMPTPVVPAPAVAPGVSLPAPAARSPPGCSAEGVQAQVDRQGEPATAMTRRERVCGTRRTIRGPSRPPTNSPIASGSAASHATRPGARSPARRPSWRCRGRRSSARCPAARPRRCRAGTSRASAPPPPPRSSRRRSRSAKVPSASHRGSRGCGVLAAPSAASSRGGRCTRIATDAPAIRNGTSRSKAPDGVSSRRTAPTAPPRTAATPSGSSRRALARELRAGRR